MDQAITIGKSIHHPGFTTLLQGLQITKKEEEGKYEKQERDLK
ncbi:MAG: hypothetical protein ACN6I5_08330 [Hyphomicrobiales bacterium]